MIDVTALQAKLQQESFAAVAAVEEVALRILSTASYNVATARVGELLTKATNEEANKIVGAWRDLLPHLITKYVINKTYLLKMSSKIQKFKNFIALSLHYKTVWIICFSLCSIFVSLDIMMVIKLKV